MREICTYGSERGALGNQRPYRDQPNLAADWHSHTQPQFTTYPSTILDRRRESQPNIALLTSLHSGLPKPIEYRPCDLLSAE